MIGHREEILSILVLKLADRHIDSRAVSAGETGIVLDERSIFGKERDDIHVEYGGTCVGVLRTVDLVETDLDRITADLSGGLEREIERGDRSGLSRQRGINLEFLGDHTRLVVAVGECIGIFYR